MAGHVYHELYVHLVWHTKSSAPMLTPELESEVFALIRTRCRETKGIYFHGIGGTETHVHLALNYEAQWSVSEIVKHFKGPCSREINKAHERKVLEWQRGFGAVSFGKRNLPTVLEYIENQKQHHRTGDLHGRLERTELDEGDEAGRPNG